ncbi:hypothetical protein ABEY63_25640 [Priestia aryabhattai]|uniref:hypothetical protein n=1 Tax=Priestia aryabhattai TaxID=412384 RepID=UPI003D293BF5
MFTGYDGLSEFEKAQVKKIRKKLSSFSDKEFSLYITMYSVIEQATGKDTKGMNFKTDLHEVCNHDLNLFLRVYYSTCHNAIIPLKEEDLDGQKAYNAFLTIGDMFYYLSSKKLI